MLYDGGINEYEDDAEYAPSIKFANQLDYIFSINTDKYGIYKVQLIKKHYTSVDFPLFYLFFNNTPEVKSSSKWLGVKK